MSDFPIANILRQQRLFNPYNERADSFDVDPSLNDPSIYSSMDFGDQTGQLDSSNPEPNYGSMDPANDTYTIDQTVGTPSHGAFQTPDMTNPNADLYAKSIEEMPTRKGTEPGFGGNLLAGLVGGLNAFAGGKTSENLGIVKGLQDEKYNEAMRDWENKTKQLGHLSDITYKGLNAKAHEANVRNRFITDAQRIDFNREKNAATEESNQKKLDEAKRLHDIQDVNADEARKATSEYRAGMLANSGRQAAASEKRAEAALTNARRPKTGNKGKPQAYYKNESEAKDAAFSDVLTDTPEFGQYLDPETGSVLRDKSGQPAKKFGNKLLPLTPLDIQAIKDFNIKVRAKTQENMNKTRNFSSSSTPGMSEEDDDE